MLSCSKLSLVVFQLKYNISVVIDVKVGDITLLYTHQLFLTTNNAFSFTHCMSLGIFMNGEVDPVNRNM